MGACSLDARAEGVGHRVGALLALPIEAASLNLGGAWVRICGQGPERAREAARALVGAGAGSLLSIGLAAGLAPGLRAGTVVLAERIVGLDGCMLPVEAAWRDEVQARVGRVLPCARGAVAETAAALLTPEDKAALHRRTAALAADMESAAVARVAACAAIGFLALRVIVDDAGCRVPAAAVLALHADGRLAPVSLLGALLRQPRDLAAMARLARRYRTARAALAALGRLAGPALRREAADG